MMTRIAPKLPATPFLFVAALALLGNPAPIRAGDWKVNGLAPPLHPSVITAEYKGKAYPITAVDGEVPEIEVEGKWVHLRGSQTFQPKLAAGFIKGLVQFRGQDASSFTVERGYRMHGDNGMTDVPGGIVSTEGAYSGTIFSSEAHKDCFIAVLFFRQDDQDRPDPKTVELAFAKIGDIPAGKNVPVKINCSYIAPPGQTYYYFAMVFEKGVEIRSDQNEIEARYFRQQEKAEQVQLLSLYRKRFADADRPAVAYLRYPPLLPSDVDPSALPKTIDAKFSVMESGDVDSLEINQALDPRVDRAIRRAIGGWLFLPRLKKGVPVRTLIDVPLSFGPS